MSWLGTACDWAAVWFICSAILFAAWVVTVEVGHRLSRPKHRNGEPVLVLLWRVKRRGKYTYRRIGEPIHLRTIVGSWRWYGQVADETPTVAYATFSSEPIKPAAADGQDFVDWLNGQDDQVREVGE